MADDDIVEYNGVKMRRDYAESLADAQLKPHYSTDDGELFPRIPFGREARIMVRYPGRPRCPCCDALEGQLHEPLCENEQCPRCEYQVMSCDCPFYTDDAVEG